ncbi:type I-C CRISPR-associated protein Cas5c [Evtepia sp.]|uniref:type I-C CRISPR-associated protein Cas5c n=1 Tax=Evtepia sp. TaxID=2773933 RepID=UPI002A7F9D1B|nr:type I-C CRISPR-associated protein Cas5c [Evtepia sp.]MDY4430608.1 type I-C CRISPR-associated protein Cas5c [Evtepia sp.]
MEVKLEVWGDFATFSPPYGKVERITYPFPTPSAARGILSALYSKPEEFYWQVTRIEVLSPIRYISFKRNEVKVKVSDTPIAADEERTQRQTVALQDVRYRITAKIVPRKGFTGNGKQLHEQALRRIRSGKNYYQPSLGLREFVAYYEESDGIRQPIPVDLDAGWMVYDVFDLHDYAVRKKTKPCLTLFHAVMKKGVIEVPPFDSPEVVRGGGSLC